MNINKNSILLDIGRIYLRQLRIEDITDEYVDGLNDPAVNRYLLNVRQSHQTHISVESYVSASMDNADNILFGIFIKEDIAPFIGTVHVSRIDLFNYSACIGICIFAKRAWKKRYALESVQTVKDYLFETVGLHYLEAGIYAANINSIKLFTKAGFEESYRVKDKFRYIDNFEETINYAAVNQSFDMSLLSRELPLNHKT